MSLTNLMGSPWPNVFALAFVFAAAIFAFLLRAKPRWGLLAATAGFIFAVVAKDTSYAKFVSGPHAENSLVAHHDYANLLLWVVGIEVTIAVCVLILGIWAWAEGRPKLRG